MKDVIRACGSLTLFLATIALTSGAAWGQTIIKLHDDAGGPACAVDPWNDANCVVDGTVFQQGSGTSSSGTGIFDPFYRIKSASADTVEGVNTGNSTVQFETEKGTWTTELLLSTVTQVYAGGVLYRELFLDINQTQGAAIYNMLDVQIYTDNQLDLNCLDPTTQTWGACDDDGDEGLVYWLDQNNNYSVQLDYTLEAGSGKRDMRMLVPDAIFGVGPDCDYGQAGCTTYAYVYSMFEPNDDGFEEWSTAIQPFVQIAKTAVGALEETTDWTIDKTVSPDDWDLFTGDSGTSDYTITLDKTVTQGNITVTGVITLFVPATLPDGDENAANAEVQSVEDTLFSAGGNFPATSISCVSDADGAVAPPFTMNPGDTVTCDYTINLGAEEIGTNEATAFVLDRDNAPRPNVTTALVESYGITSLGEPGTINVTDDYATPGDGIDDLAWGPFSDDATITYSRTFTCDADEGTFTNIASIDETDDADDATVTVDCWQVNVSKTTATDLIRNYSWTVNKSVDPAAWQLFTNESGTSDYTVDVTRSFTDGGFQVTGTITVSVDVGSPDAVLNGVSDLVTPGDIAATVDCGVGFPYTLSDGVPLECTYSTTLPDDSDRTNTATTTAQNYSYASDGTPTPSGTTNYSSVGVGLDFSNPTILEVDETATATDDWATPGDDADDQQWPFGGDGQQTYSITFTCDTDEGTRTNTVVIVGDDTGTEFDSDDATVTVTCYEIEVAKTAATSFTVTHTWDITKTVTPEAWDLLTGDSGTSDYTIDLDETETPSDWAVAGVITISNNTPLDATINSLGDVISPAIAASVDCGVSFPTVILAGESLDCDYTADLPDASDRTNTATAARQNNNYASDGTPTPSGETDVSNGAEVDFSTADVTHINPEVNVTDDYASPGDPADDLTWGPFDGDDSVTYSRTFSCDGDEGTFTNTAVIDETGDSDDATVTVDCWSVVVTKDAETAKERSYTWTVEKSVDPDSWDLFRGDTGTSEYTIDVTRTANDGDFAVRGEIWVDIEAGAPIGADITDVTDLVSPDIAATVSCGVTFPQTITDGAGLSCDYSANLLDEASRTNTATATYQNNDYASDGTPTPSGTTDVDSDPADVVFNGGTEITEVDPTATVTDDWATPGDTGDDEQWQFSGNGQQTYEITFACDADEGTRTNTVKIVGDETGFLYDTDDATATVRCHELIVTKEADPSFERHWDWTIDKSVTDPEEAWLTLSLGQTYGPIEYDIDVSGDYIDQAFKVEGLIYVDNQTPLSAEITGVDDVIQAGDIDGLPSCPSFPYTIAPGDSLTCSYGSVDLPDGDQRENQAKAGLQNKAYHHTDATVNLPDTTYWSGSIPVDFTGIIPAEFDECILVTDQFPEDGVDTLGEFCGTTSPSDTTFVDSLTVVVPDDPTACTPDSLIVNTARFVTNDNGDTGQDTAHVHIEVPCPEGCTLTLGYWKTHNPTFHGGAPPDLGWFEIGDWDGDGVEEQELEDFYKSDSTWFGVFWTPVGGNPYYSLAHQYMAAVLNSLNGAGVPDSVDWALKEADKIFDHYTPDDFFEIWTNPSGNKTMEKKKQQLQKRANYPMVILSKYNEGGYENVPHCDEDETSSLTLQGSVASKVARSRSEQEQNASRVEEAQLMSEDIPTEFAIGNYPNPFNPTTTLLVELPEDAVVTVIVYDALGRRVTSLISQELDAGRHRIVWNAGSLPSGAYFYVVESEKYAGTGSMLLVK